MRQNDGRLGWRRKEGIMFIWAGVRLLLTCGLWCCRCISQWREEERTEGGKREKACHLSITLTCLWLYAMPTFMPIFFVLVAYIFFFLRRI